MKVVIYTDTVDGNIPGYILDGGYFGKPNGNGAPQDWDFVGIAADGATETELASLEELTAYAETFLDAVIEDVFSGRKTLTDTLNEWWQEKVTGNTPDL